MITSDQSQIGYIGVPLLFIGGFVGTPIGASRSAHLGKVMLGVGAGLVLGLGGGVFIDAAFRAAGTTVAGVWLLLAPAAMIAGGVAGAWWDEHARPPRAPATLL